MEGILLWVAVGVSIAELLLLLLLVAYLNDCVTDRDQWRSAYKKEQQECRMEIDRERDRTSEKRRELQKVQDELNQAKMKLERMQTVLDGEPEDEEDDDE